MDGAFRMMVARMNGSGDEIILRIRCNDAVAAVVNALVEPIVEAHAGVVRRGGFSGTTYTSAPAELRFAADGGASDRRYDVQARFVDPGAWRVLFDAVRGELWLKDLAPHSDVQCSVITAAGDVLGSRELEAIPYPSSPRQMPFQLSWHADGPPLRAAVRIFLRDVPSPETIEEIRTFLVEWQRLIRAYSPPQRADIPFGGAIPTDALWMQPYAVELTLDAFLADESVFHPIINFACWLHGRRVTVEELVIE
jgi:hypothetical protein